MTLEEKRIERLYKLLHQIEHKDPDMTAVLRWAIFEFGKDVPQWLTSHTSGCRAWIKRGEAD